MNAALAETGPLVARFVRNDPDHPRVSARLREYRGRLLTTWPVRTETEVFHFLDFAALRTPQGKAFRDVLAAQRPAR